MSIKLAVVCVSLFIIPAFVSFARGQQDEHTSTMLNERADFATGLAGIKSQILVKLEPQEAAIAKHLVIHVVQNGDIQYCQAGRPSETGELPIYVSQEFLRSLHMFIMAEVIAQDRHDSELAETYLDYVIAGFHKSMDNPSSPPRIESPQVWMHLSPSEEHRVVEETGRYWTNSMAFVLSHELAHHILGHTKDLKAPSRQILIQREVDADAWATRHLLALGVSPTASSYPLAYFGALFVDLGDRAEHPAGSCRGRAQMVATLENLDLLKTASGSRYFDIDAARKKLNAAIYGMDHSPDGCPQGKDGHNAYSHEGTSGTRLEDDAAIAAAETLAQSISSFITGTGQRDLCASKGKFLTRDGTEREYETQYKPLGWEGYISVDRGERGCLLYIERDFRSSSESERVFSIAKSYIVKRTEGCEEEDSEQYDGKLRCASIGATLGFRGGKRPSVTFIVDGN